LRAQAGSSYDPRLIDIFVVHVHELEAAADEAARNISELSFRKYFEKLDGTETPDAAPVQEEAFLYKASEELVRLFEFCGGVGRSLSLADALPILARRMQRIVPYNTCAFFICQEDGSVKAEFAGGEFAEALQGVSIGLGKGISGWVAAYKRTMINTGPALEFQGIEGNFAPLRDALVVPLLQDGDCIGTISLYSTTAAFFTQSHLSLLQTLADQAAPLIRAAGTSASSQEQSLLDPVTGVHRFTYLSVAGAQILRHAERSEAPLSLLYLEIRNFQQIVTLYGVATGDLILRRVADILRAELRQTDVLVRYGPQGFAALLAGVRSPQAQRYAQRLLQQIKATPINLSMGNTSFVTCQAGIAAYPSDGSTLLGLLQAAQKALDEHARLAGSQTPAVEGNVLEFPPRL
jgi:diguanylate cyclase (GGDEF)-like protein